ncbi:transferrin 2 isoform X1 [Zophobas morio]|uniref:transferrin 2 isoform X1 n=1 Tax=Zophobas morio TaxID=2755281 RepID=UPI0030828C72
MGFRDRTYLYLFFLIIVSVFVISAGQNFWKTTQFENEPPEDKRIKIVWCTISRPEQRKCRNFAMANERDKIKVGYDAFKIDCIQAYDKEECMRLLDQGNATITTLDAGEVFVGGRYNSLVPISQEVLEGGSQHYYAVAVIKKDTLPEVHSLFDLKSTRACFAGVEKFAGWVVPIYTLMNEGGMEIIDCNNHVKTATKYFGPSCAVNCLTDKYNPIGDNSDRLCQLCIGKIPGGRCSSSDPYAGYEGAFRCLVEAGDIAFLKHTTVAELVALDEFVSITKESFQLLCKDGSRRPVDDYMSCNWGRVPSDAIVTTSASSFEKRKKYQLFLEKAAKIYNHGNRHNTSQYDQDQNRYDSREPQYDQFGNRINDHPDDDRYGRPEYDQYGNRVTERPEYDQYGNRVTPQPEYDQYGNKVTARPEYDQYGNKVTDRPGYDQHGNRDTAQPEYDQYGNRVSRYKRQNFGNFGGQDRPRYDSNNYNQYGRDETPNNDPYRTNNDNRYGNTERPFYRDPHIYNRQEYGVNIDPYEDGSYNRNRDQFYNNSLPDYYDNGNRNNTFFEVFSLFESSPRYGIHGNLLFQDSTRNIVPLNENLQTYTSFLGNSMNVLMGVRECPVNRMTLCVTSEVEKDKCIKMKIALKAQLLKPDMECYRGHSQINCMQAVRSGLADVTVLDASDIYTAGLNFELIPFISEIYNLNEPESYVVAVGKESDPDTELTYLRGKYTCHGGINTAAGWVYPLAFLISNGWIRPYGCNSIRAAAEYFSKSCVPGALSTEYNTGVPYDNMCDLCHGTSYRYCRRDASEDYYGHTGAFRCLVEGGGQVAFVTHTTVTQNTGGKREEWWARDNLNDDFELLCPDGTRAEIQDYEKCNLGKVKANAIVTRGGYGYNETHLNAFINLFLYAQTFYGRRTTDEFSFSMFSSKPPFTDLIFQDATTQLKVIHPTKRHYAEYLGSDFLRARRIVDCHAGSASISASIITLLSVSAVVMIVRL